MRCLNQNYEIKSRNDDFKICNYDMESKKNYALKSRNSDIKSQNYELHLHLCI